MPAGETSAEPTADPTVRRVAYALQPGERARRDRGLPRRGRRRGRVNAGVGRRLCLNAGVGNAGPFIETPLADDRRLIALNIDHVVHTAKRLLPAMVERGHGRVLITSSIAALMPGPWCATYAASKAFLQSFAEAIRYELKDTGVTVTALLPGPTDTDFFERANLDGTMVDEGPKDDPADVARDGIEAMFEGKDQVVAGSWRNRVQALLSKGGPDSLKAALHAQQTKST